MRILSSASKLVFILIAAAVIAGLFIGKVDPKDFFVLASMVFAFYFSKKQDDPVETTTITTPSTSKVDTSVTTVPIDTNVITKPNTKASKK